MSGALPAKTAAPPRVSAVVVSFNTRDHLLRCLASLERHVTLPLEVVVVDNASTDGSADSVRGRFPAVRLVANPRNLGFGAACNRGLRAATGAYRLLLNSDAEVGPGSVEALAALLDARPDVGIVAPRTRSADGAIQVSFGPALTPWREWTQRRLVRAVRRRDPSALRRLELLAGVEREPFWVSGACLLARAEALDAISGFDEGYFLYEEDVDLCVRVRRAGWRVVYTPSAEVVHALGASMARAAELARVEYQRSHLRYYARHNGRALTAMLRAMLVVRSVAGWVAALRAGEQARVDRRVHATVARLAVSPISRKQVSGRSL
jgi:GT2 family glycosyltransferase